MLTRINEVESVLFSIFMDHSNRVGAAPGIFQVAVAGGGATTALIIDLSTVNCAKLNVGISSTVAGTIVIRKFFAGGTLFVDENFALGAPGAVIVSSTTLMEFAQILFTNPGAPAGVVQATAIGRSAS